MANKKKIRQGHSRWIVWCTRGELPPTLNTLKGGHMFFVSCGSYYVCLERLEVVYTCGETVVTQHGGSRASHGMDRHSYRVHTHPTYRRALREMNQVIANPTSFDLISTNH